MSKIVTSFNLTELVTKTLREEFIILLDSEIDSQVAHAKKRIDEFVATEKKKMRAMANTMTLELLQKINVDGLSVEFKM